LDDALKTKIKQSKRHFPPRFVPNGICAVSIAQNSGCIISIASVAGPRGGISGHIYSAAKAAVIQLSRNVTAELADSGVRLNTISPGGVVTGIFAKSARVADA
jgi:NAD(P)-dependent dehydrogenase (short-subunit alcohol dehydrogenase family)